MDIELSLQLKTSQFLDPPHEALSLGHFSPKRHIWRISRENDSKKCSHTDVCCAFFESFSPDLQKI
jgi:hypothetical protein